MTLPGHFQHRRDGIALGLLSIDGMIVLGSGIAAYHLRNPIVAVLAFVFVGARGQSLYILQHEAMHGLLLSNRRINDCVGIVLSAFLGTQFFFGRALHMRHHRDVGLPTDPNEYFHRVDDKKPKKDFLRFFLFQLLGGRLLLLIAGLTKAILGIVGMKALATKIPYAAGSAAVTVGEKYRRCDLIVLVVVQSAVFAFVATSSAWYVYFLLYLLPLSTLTACFEFIRSFSEHVLVGAPTTEAEQHRRFFMNEGFVESFFISQHDFHYHHVHHLYPNIPTFNVRAVHLWLQENDATFDSTFIERPGYVRTMLLYFLKEPFPGQGAIASHGVAVGL